MKTLKFLPIIALVLFSFTSCSDDDGPNLQPIDAETISNLHAPTTSVNGPMGPTPDGGAFTKFDFETGLITTSETDWDIAFRSTAIIINGGQQSGADDEPVRNGNAGVYIVEDTFDNVVDIDTNLFTQDSSSGYAIVRQSDQGWYNYSGFGNPDPADDNLVTPLPGRTLVFRTRDGRFAKVRILSYYLDNPSNPVGTGMNADTPRYYTFQYEYQPNEGVTTFE